MATEKTKPAWMRPLITIGLLCVVVGGVAWFNQPQRGQLRVWFLDTPGDAVLVQSPGGEYVLIDGGEDPTLLAQHLGEHVPFWQRTLRAIVLTRSEEASLTGPVAALSRYRAKLVLAPRVWHMQEEAWGLGEVVQRVSTERASVALQAPLTVEWVHLLQDRQTKLLPAQPGQQLRLDGAVLTVLAAASNPLQADDDAPAGVVLHLQYGVSSLLLVTRCAAVENPALAQVARPVTVLAYPWACAMETPLLQAWQPQTIVFLTGEHLDDPALLTYAERRRLGGQGRPIALYHQKLDGTVTVVCERGYHRRADGGVQPACVVVEGYQ
jgi:hypothetical protein